MHEVESANGFGLHIGDQMIKFPNVHRVTNQVALKVLLASSFNIDSIYSHGF